MVKAGSAVATRRTRLRRRYCSQVLSCFAPITDTLKDSMPVSIYWVSMPAAGTLRHSDLGLSEIEPKIESTSMKYEKKSHWGAGEKRWVGRLDSAHNKAIADHRHAADQIKHKHETKYYYVFIHLQRPNRFSVQYTIFVDNKYIGQNDKFLDLRDVMWNYNNNILLKDNKEHYCWRTKAF